jgi:hypothetical protein
MSVKDEDLKSNAVSTSSSLSGGGLAAIRFSSFDD